MERSVEPVHLDEELVEGLLALVVTAAETSPTLATHDIDLVDEDDRGRARLRLLEQIAHPRGAHPDEHLDEVGARDREERHAGLAGDGAGKQRLAGARWTEEQHASRDLRSHRLELRRVLEVVLDLLQLFDRVVDARDVAERGLRLVLVHHVRGVRTASPTPAARERFITKSRMPPIRSTGRITAIKVPSNALGFCGSTSVATPACSSLAVSSSAKSVGYDVRYVRRRRDRP